MCDESNNGGTPSMFQDLMLGNALARKFHKAGFINDKLQLTGERGVRAIQRVVFEKLSVELEKLADAQIAEDAKK